MLSYKVISRLLICVLFVQVLFPLQVHMHHESAAMHHDSGEHIVDYHNKVIGSIDESHEEYAHSIEITSNFIVKKSLDDTHQIALILTLILLGLLLRSAYYLQRNKLSPVLQRNYSQLSPPLRAPPL